MIARVSEKPFWGPEEQIRKFINQHDEPLVAFQAASTEQLVQALERLNFTDPLPTDEARRNKIRELIVATAPSDCVTEAQKEMFFAQQIANYLQYQQTLTQQRIENIDNIFQKQLIWSYGREVDDAYFYWDWCPIGSGTSSTDPKWQIVQWEEYQVNKDRNVDRPFNWKEIRGYTNQDNDLDEMPKEYDARSDMHAKSADDTNVTIDDLDQNTLRHNIMRSYLEVSEWLGDGALQYGSHNGFVSRKMSMAWLFCAIRALINWKMNNQDKFKDRNIEPLNIGHIDPETGNWTYDVDSSGNNICERFLNNGEQSSCGIQYNDETDLNQTSGNCALQPKVRAANPEKQGTLVVRGNERHYGERAWFWTHNSFIGECRFFHNTRFLGQATFDKEINGTAMRTRWADLAENYVSDKQCETGTLMMFGGEKEVTVSDGKTVNGIVTTKPGLVLNGDLKDDNVVGLALVGRVPVKICEKVHKFDKVVPSRKFPGYACRRRWYEFWKKPIGIALADSVDGLVECVTKLEF